MMKEREVMREGWGIIFKVKDCSASGNLKLKCLNLFQKFGKDQKGSKI